MIAAHNLSYSYQQNNGSILALKELSLQVSEGSTCAIIGPSGCGKTTLLYILAGLLKPDQGQVLLNGKSAGEQRKDIALILQEYGLLPWKNVLGNVSLGLQFRKVDKDTIKKQVDNILKELEIMEYKSHYPSQLSGGQRQRVAIARALTLKPGFLFMDEPFSSLDALTREGMQRLFLRLWKKYKMTTVLVTHSIEEAVYLGENIIIMTSGPGRIIAKLENEHFAREGWRDSVSFYEKCQQIRYVLEEGLIP